MIDPASDPRVLLLGCGDLGTRIGRLLADRGHEVTGVRRRAEAIPAPIRGMGADLIEDDLPDLPTDLLVVALTADQRDEGGYRRTYLEGMARGLEAVLRSGTPRRAVLVSSTSVNGDVEGAVDETTTPEPSRPTGRVLLEAEEHFLERLPHGTVARLSGLYGPARNRVVDQVRRGENPDPGRMTNRVHRDDAAAAVAHLLTEVDDPERLYLVSDDAPCPTGEVRDFVADELGTARPAPTGRTAPFGKRLVNTRLRATGLALTYPTHREGYRAVLAEEAVHRRD